MFLKIKISDSFSKPEGSSSTISNSSQSFVPSQREYYDIKLRDLVSKAATTTGLFCENHLKLQPYCPEGAQLIYSQAWCAKRWTLSAFRTFLMLYWLLLFIIFQQVREQPAPSNRNSHKSCTGTS